MTHASLCSGIGGFDLAASWAGLENLFNCEIDPFCRKVLLKHFPESTQYEDLTTTDFSLWNGRVDVLSAGFPCQPYSVAGKQLGAADNRAIWPQVLRVIREVRPTYFLGENVTGIIRLALDEVLTSLEAEGYTCETFIVQACAVGAPHRRDRVWIVAYSNKHSQSISAFHASKGQWISSHSYSKRLPQGCSCLAARQEQPCGLNPSRGITANPHEFNGHCSGFGTSSAALIQEGEIQQEFRLTESPICRMDARFSEWMDGSGIAIENEDIFNYIDLIINNLYGTSQIKRTVEELPLLWSRDSANTNEWTLGRLNKIQKQEVLQSYLLWKFQGDRNANPKDITCKSKGFEEKELREVWEYSKATYSSFRFGLVQQRSIEPDDTLRALSYTLAPTEWKKTAEKTCGLQNLWFACKELGYVPETFAEVQEVWQSLSDENKAWTIERIGLGSIWANQPPDVSPICNSPRLVRNRGKQIKAYGNAIVPQVALQFFQAIQQHHQLLTNSK